MKKIKIMLTAITVFAVVGGALAFKAKGTTVLCSTTISPVANCIPQPDQTFVANEEGQSYCTTIEGTVCDVKSNLAEQK